MIKTSMAKIWEKKIDKVSYMISLVQEVINGTPEDNIELLSGLLEYRSDLKEINKKFITAYISVVNYESSIT